MELWVSLSHNYLICTSTCICQDISMGFPCGSAGKESACNVGDLGLIPGLGRFPWRRERLLTPVFLPEFHGLHSSWMAKSGTQQSNLHFHFFFFNFYFYFILLYNTVLVLPYIDMNPPQVYMRSQTWTPLPPPSPQHCWQSNIFAFDYAI